MVVVFHKVLVTKSVPLQKPLNQPDEQGQQNTNEQHRRNRKIELEIFTLHADITGQTAQPGQFIAKKINQQADEHDKQAQINNKLSG